jgi:hypothetical protein
MRMIFDCRIDSDGQIWKLRYGVQERYLAPICASYITENTRRFGKNRRHFHLTSKQHRSDRTVLYFDTITSIHPSTIIYAIISCDQVRLISQFPPKDPLVPLLSRKGFEILNTRLKVTASVLGSRYILIQSSTLQINQRIWKSNIVDMTSSLVSTGHLMNSRWNTAATQIELSGWVSFKTLGVEGGSMLNKEDGRKEYWWRDEYILCPNWHLLAVLFQWKRLWGRINCSLDLSVGLPVPNDPNYI